MNGFIVVVQKSKIFFIRLMFSLALLCLSVRQMHALSNVKFSGYLSKASCYVTQAGNHLFSCQGAKDTALAYCLGMGLTTVHELGHAIVAKILYGCPINITMGASPSTPRKPCLRIGGFKLGGFNPATAYASVKFTDNSPLKEAAVCIAGPVCGAISSFFTYYLLRNNGNHPLCKGVALYGLFNHTLGFAGLASIGVPRSDSTRFIQAIKRAIRNNN